MSYNYATSRPAYTEASQHLARTHEAVLKAAGELGEFNDRMLREKLGWQINRLTPRRGELVTMGRIVPTVTKLDTATNRTVQYYRLSAYK